MEYLGQYEVKSFETDGDFVVLTLDSGPTTRLHKDLYAMMKSDEKIEVPIEDIKYSVLAKYFISQLATFDLLAHEVYSVANNMENHAGNAHAQATKKLWGGKTASDISIKEIQSVLEK